MDLHVACARISIAVPSGGAGCQRKLRVPRKFIADIPKVPVALLVTAMEVSRDVDHLLNDFLQPWCAVSGGQHHPVHLVTIAWKMHIVVASPQCLRNVGTHVRRTENRYEGAVRRQLHWSNPPTRAQVSQLLEHH